jgi:hypothetical protein
MQGMKKKVHQAYNVERSVGVKQGWLDGMHKRCKNMNGDIEKGD